MNIGFKLVKFKGYKTCLFCVFNNIMEAITIITAGGKLLLKLHNDKNPLFYLGERGKMKATGETHTSFITNAQKCAIVKYKAPHLICLKKAVALCRGLPLRSEKHQDFCLKEVNMGIYSISQN